MRRGLYNPARRVESFGAESECRSSLRGQGPGDSEPEDETLSGGRLTRDRSRTGTGASPPARKKGGRGRRGRKPGWLSRPAKGTAQGSDGDARERFTTVLLAAFALVSVLVALEAYANTGEVRRGVDVAGVSIGGSAPAEASEMLSERVNGDLGRVELAGRRDVSLGVEELGADYDVRQTVADAYTIGRKGNVASRLWQRLGANFGGTEVPFEVAYQRDVARDRIEDLATELNQERRDASVEVAGSGASISDSREGYALDVDATLASIDGAVRNLTGEAALVGDTIEPDVTTIEARRVAEKADRAMSGPLVLTADDREWNISAQEIGTALEFEREGDTLDVGLRKGGLGEYMGAMYDELNVSPTEAGFEVEGENVTVTPSETGMEIQDEKFFDSMSEGIFTGQREYAVPVAVADPELTTEEARQEKPTAMIGSYETNYLTYDDTPGRIENLDISSQAVDGTVLAPGEVFSFNELAEPLDYYETKVIVDGRSDTAEGGGLCQVSSTLYMAANLANLEIVERSPHYAELPYIRPGFDATVWFGAIDFKFKNTTGNHILLREWVDRSTGMVHSEIWGQPDDSYVEMNSEQVARYRDEKRKPVTEWVTYKTVTENGDVTFSGVVNEDTYKYLKPAEEDASAVRPPN